MDASNGSGKRVLDPIDRVSEVLFGLIMVLTFTGSLSIAEAGRGDVREMLVGALGCNVAWGLIDGLFYLMGCLAESGRRLATLRAVRDASEPKAVRSVLADALPPAVAGVLRPDELDTLSRRLKELPEPAGRPRLTSSEWLGSVAVFLLVFLSTLPPTLPFLFVSDLHLAMRISNGIAVALLYAAGHAFGKMTGRRPIPTGLAMVVLGSLLVALTIALGG